MNVLLAGFIAGIPVGVIGGLLLWLRGKSYVPELKATNAEMAKWSDQLVTLMLAGGSALASLAFGVLAGWVYGQFAARFASNAAIYFLALAIGLAVIASILALVSKTPMVREKIVLNLDFGIGFGLLVPWLAG
jgi:hypothetical protein